MTLWYLLGYLETGVKFQIWLYNTYRGYLETDIKFHIRPYDTYNPVLFPLKEEAAAAEDGMGEDDNLIDNMEKGPKDLKESEKVKY